MTQFALAMSFLAVTYAAAATSEHTQKTSDAISEASDAFPQFKNRVPTNEEMQRVLLLAMGTVWFRSPGSHCWRAYTFISLSFSRCKSG
jgi:hypothetical protein